MYQLEKMTPIKIISFGSRTCDVAVMMRVVFTMILKTLASLIKLLPLTGSLGFLGPKCEVHYGVPRCVTKCDRGGGQDW